MSKISTSLLAILPCKTTWRIPSTPYMLPLSVLHKQHTVDIKLIKLILFTLYLIPEKQQKQKQQLSFAFLFPCKDNGSQTVSSPPPPHHHQLTIPITSSWECCKKLTYSTFYFKIFSFPLRNVSDLTVNWLYKHF